MWGWRARAVGLIALVAVCASILVATTPPTEAQAANLNEFDAGRIIDDSVFYASGTMTEGAVQSFLNSKVSACRSGYTCLKDFRQDTWSRAADPMCGAYQGGGGESAARIIVKVAASCGINPQVLIVLLQKEQGLVTDTWPTATQYRKATGYACPDTGDCDSTYNGYYNQVYMAAWAFKRYGQPAGTGPGTEWYSRFDLSYPVGQWSNIQYNPNAGCGTQRVFIQNQATHALYVYTPYVPNPSALNAGYGTGDGCGAYGNRNFFLYFNDWFGSTSGSDLVRTAQNPDVFLLAPGGRYAVRTLDQLAVLAPLGSVRTVSQGLIDSYPARGDASGLARDSSTGAIYSVGDGKRFHYRSCDQIAAFGASCSSFMNLSSAQIARFGDAGEVTNFIKGAGRDPVYFFESGKRRQVAGWWSYTTLARLTGESGITSMPQGQLERVGEGAPIAGPGALLKSPASNDVWFADGRGAKRHLTSFDHSRDLGVGTTVTTVASTVLDSMVTRSPLNSSLVSCGPDYYVGSGGALWSLGEATGYGVGSIALDPVTCSVLTKGPGRTGAGAMMIQGAGSSTVYLVAGGQKRALSSWAAYLQNEAAAGGVLVRDASSALLDKWRTGDPLHADASLVKVGTRPEVYLIDGRDSAWHVINMDFVSDLGFGTSIATVSSVSGYSVLGQIRSAVVTCGGSGYVADDGQLVPLSPSSSNGLSPATLRASTCTNVAGSPAAVDSVFVKSRGADTVWLVDSGARRAVSSWAALMSYTDGQVPRILTWSPGTLAALPEGPAV